MGAAAASERGENTVPQAASCSWANGIYCCSGGGPGHTGVLVPSFHGGGRASTAAMAEELSACEFIVEGAQHCHEGMDFNLMRKAEVAMSNQCFADDSDIIDSEAAVRDASLLQASSAGDLEAIRAAISAGANMEARQSSATAANDTAREPTDSEEDFQEVLVLEDGGSVFHPGGFGFPERPPLRDDHGLTPLMRAAKSGMPQAIALLLELKATPHSQDETGLTPLHYAAQAGCRQSCSVLLSSGANRWVLDDAFLDAYAHVPRHLLEAPQDKATWATMLRPEELFRSNLVAQKPPKCPATAPHSATVAGPRQPGHTVPTGLPLAPSVMAPQHGESRMPPVPGAWQGAPSRDVSASSVLRNTSGGSTVTTVVRDISGNSKVMTVVRDTSGNTISSVVRDISVAHVSTVMRDTSGGQAATNVVREASPCQVVVGPCPAMAEAARPLPPWLGAARAAHR